jgi:quercetin dioxygenase-like cupin family protein
VDPCTILKLNSLAKVQRGDGVVTTLLVGSERVPGVGFTTGLTSFPPGRSAPLHSHNCGEQVIILDGDAEVEVEGKITRLGRYDSAYIAAEIPHRYQNVGATPLLILWIYGAERVTRTFTTTGVTVEHLSAGDKVNPT